MTTICENVAHCLHGAFSKVLCVLCERGLKVRHGVCCCRTRLLGIGLVGACCSTVSRNPYPARVPGLQSAGPRADRIHGLRGGAAGPAQGALRLREAVPWARGPGVAAGKLGAGARNRNLLHRPGRRPRRHAARIPGVRTE